jgi:hypothetical protein
MSLTHLEKIEHLTTSVTQQPKLPPPTGETLTIGGLDAATYIFVSGFLVGMTLTKYVLKS